MVVNGSVPIRGVNLTIGRILFFPFMGGKNPSMVREDPLIGSQKLLKNGEESYLEIWNPRMADIIKRK